MVPMKAIVTCGVRHRAVEAQMLGPASERPVRADDLGVAFGVEDVSEQIDLVLDSLDCLLDLLDGGRQGDGRHRKLCDHGRVT